MNSAHLHLLLNHFPIIGTLIGIGLLAVGFLRKNDTLKLSAAWIIAVMTLLSLPLPSTGEAAEEVSENLPGVSEAVIEAHEEAAMIAMWIMGAAGLIAVTVIVLSRMKKGAARPAMLVLLLVSGLAFAAMARTGYLGGKIRHQEVSSTMPGTPNAAPAGETEDDD